MSIEIFPGSLFLVATPIGNLADITQRAIETLRDVDLVAAEDTRHSRRLINHLGIKCRMLAYHEHNEDQQAVQLIERLRQGESIALISDAGTPLMSDPGYRLVKMAHEQGVRVIPIPGACAAVAAMSASGLASDRFCFEGFPPAKQGARQRVFQALQYEARSMIFYVSCHRIQNTLLDMMEIFGQDREATLAREITKQYETIRKANLGTLHDWVVADEMQQKGEFVVVVAGVEVVPSSDEKETDNLLGVLIEELPLKQAAKIAAKISGKNRNQLYSRALEIKNGRQQND